MAGLPVVVAGALANKPCNGGEAWVRLSWIRGLRQLGCDVWFVEQIAERDCVDRTGRTSSFAASVNLSWFRDVTAQFDLSHRSWLVCDTGEVNGPPLDHLAAVATDALLVNISGHLQDAHLMTAFRRRAYIDIDPGFTQIWHEQGNPGARLPGHDTYFTIGGNIGRTGCSIPTNGVGWQHVRPPVVLDDWPPVVRAPVADKMVFTTIATWRGPFGPLVHDGRCFGLKVHEFRKYLTLPTLVPSQFELALAIHPSETNDLQLLGDNGWELTDPDDVAGTPAAFRDYVAGSAAEFSVAQGVYVETWSGWFSDRTTRYLASGRPALVQDTGFSRDLPVGSGVVAFGDLSEAVAGAEAIRRDYDMHAAAARHVAETYFDSDIVLTRFLERCDLERCRG